jgi:hypothetical protein
MEAKMSGKYGPKVYEDYYFKEDQLHEWTSQAQQGIMGICADCVPEECYQFCYSQYVRFNIPLPHCIDEIINSASMATFHHVDIVDPYCLLSGTSDVNTTSDWCYHAYEALDTWDNEVKELNPESIETFVAVPGQAEAVFEDIMSHPGLEALPNMVGEYLDGSIRGISDYAYYQEHPLWTYLEPDALLELRGMCIDKDGTFNETRLLAYFRLAAWATFAWIAGPPSRQFRLRHHEIMSAAMQHGECILVDGMTIAPTHYRKLARPPQSCYKCGVAGWCVEMVSTRDFTSYLCEHCSSEGMPKLSKSLATCGSKMCMYAECPHNPYHHLGGVGIHRARADYGQLGAMAQGELFLPEEGVRKLK